LSLLFMGMATVGACEVACRFPGTKV